MGNLDYKPFYEGNLPHIQPPGATFFVTACLHAALPAFVIKQLDVQKERLMAKAASLTDAAKREKEEYRIYRHIFGKWDYQLARAEYGPIWLAKDKIAAKVAEALHHRHGRVYDLHAFTIMPNHIHYLCSPYKINGKWVALQRIGHSLKSYTATQCNRILGRHGQFWQHESHDHYVRNAAEYERILQYILNNPVDAGLVDDWQDWPWTYCADYH